MLRQFLYESVVSLKTARAVFRELRRDDLPKHPSNYESVRTLLERKAAREAS